MDDTAMPWDARRARRMEQERPHQQRSSKADYADLLGQALGESRDLLLGGSSRVCAIQAEHVERRSPHRRDRDAIAP